MFIEKHQGIHRLVLRRRSDVSVHGQVSQERFDLRFGGQGGDPVLVTLAGTDGQLLHLIVDVVRVGLGGGAASIE